MDVLRGGFKVLDDFTIVEEPNEPAEAMELIRQARFLGMELSVVDGQLKIHGKSTPQISRVAKRLGELKAEAVAALSLEEWIRTKATKEEAVRYVSEDYSWVEGMEDVFWNGASP